MSNTPNCDPQLPRFSRLNYFFGQALSHVDFRDAQRYFRDKLRLRNRCIHGWGVVCGLDVSLDRPSADPCCPPSDVDPQQLYRRAEQLEVEAARLEKTLGSLGDAGAEAKTSIESAISGLREQAEKLKALAKEASGALDETGKAVRVVVSPGVAVSPSGDELVAAGTIEVDLWGRLTPEDRRLVASGRIGTLYVSACYSEHGLCPVRPVVFDGCGPLDETHGRIGEFIDIRVSTEPPEQGEDCLVCCGGSPCRDCVLLARVELQGEHGAPIVDNDVRRMLTLYDPVRITEVSWKHGATYDATALQNLLGRRLSDGSNQGQGLTLRFSRPVRVETLRDGVFEVMRYFGGGAPSGGIAWMPFAMDPVSTTWTKEVTFRQATDERWSPGDRVMIVLRGDYVLDRCCIPIDGSPQAGHIGLIEGSVSPVDPSDADRRRTGGSYIGTHREVEVPAAGEAEEEPRDSERSTRESSACDHRLFRLVASAPGGRFESWVNVR